MPAGSDPRSCRPIGAAGGNVTLSEVLLQMMDDAFDHEAWHGENLMDSLRKLTAAQAEARSREGYSAWQVALHCAYWKWVTRRSLHVGGLVGGVEPFGRAPDDWPAVPAARTQLAWQRDLEFLADEHKRLRDAAAGLSEEQLLLVQPDNRFSHARSLYAIAAHDAYHTGMLRNMGVPGADFGGPGPSPV
jgi:hypothetical protein